MSIQQKIICCFLSSIVTVYSCGNALAQDVLQPAQVLITELQTESDLSANEEFIELTSNSPETVDLTGWAIQYRSATGTTWTDKAQLSGSLYPGGSIVISTQGYNVDHSAFFWTGTGGQLAATGGNIRIIAPNSIIATDTLAWGTGIFGEGTASAKAVKGKTLHRKQIDKVFVDTDSNVDDFIEDIADPVNNNTAPELPPSDTGGTTDTSLDTTPIETPPDPVVTPIPDPIDPTPTPVDPILPDVPAGLPAPSTDTPPVQLSPIVINELMINPSAPLLDSDDEWIELYNPNPEPFALKDFKIQTGSSYSYTYEFTDQVIGPNGYLVLKSSVSGLALSNTAGAVRILDATGIVTGSNVTYDDVEEGSTYALDTSGAWKWTTTPTEGVTNVFTEAPVVIKSTVSSPKKTTAVKSASVKASTAKASNSKSAPKASTSKSKSSTTNANTSFDDPAPVQESRPLLLASFVVIAVLYGLYEYREDLSNSLWRARRYLAARKNNRHAL